MQEDNTNEVVDDRTKRLQARNLQSALEEATGNFDKVLGNRNKFKPHQGGQTRAPPQPYFQATIQGSKSPTKGQPKNLRRKRAKESRENLTRQNQTVSANGGKQQGNQSGENEGDATASSNIISIPNDGSTSKEPSLQEEEEDFEIVRLPKPITPDVVIVNMPPQKQAHILLPSNIEEMGGWKGDDILGNPNEKYLGHPKFDEQALEVRARILRGAIRGFQKGYLALGLEIDELNDVFNDEGTLDFEKAKFIRQQINVFIRTRTEIDQHYYQAKEDGWMDEGVEERLTLSLDNLNGLYTFVNGLIQKARANNHNTSDDLRGPGFTALQGNQLSGDPKGREVEGSFQTSSPRDNVQSEAQTPQGTPEPIFTEEQIRVLSEDLARGIHAAKTPDEKKKKRRYENFS